MPLNSDRPRVFISYLRENTDVVDHLVSDLERAGLEVWYDRKALQAGMYWKEEIRQAIQRGDYFIACFSRELQQRERAYMSEELHLAIDEIRMRSSATWFLPVILSGSLPHIRISSSVTLADIQYVDFTQATWAVSIDTLVRSIQTDFAYKMEQRNKLLRKVFPLGEWEYAVQDSIFETPPDYAFSLPPYSGDPKYRSPEISRALEQYRKRIFEHLHSAVLSQREVALMKHLLRSPLRRPSSVSPVYACISACVAATWPTLEGDPDVANIRPLARECFDQDNEWQFRLWNAAVEAVAAYLNGRELRNLCTSPSHAVENAS